MSSTVPDHELPTGRPSARGGVAPGAGRTLRVEAVFKDVDEPHVQVLAAEMIDRAHQLANRPECECDVDVSVQWASPGDTAHVALESDVAAPAHHAGHAGPRAGGRCAER